jgi:hypothetical protein
MRRRRGRARQETQAQGDNAQKRRDTGQGSEPPIEGRPSGRGCTLLGRFGGDSLQACLHARGKRGGHGRRIVRLTEQASDVRITGSPIGGIHGETLCFKMVSHRDCATALET